MMKSAGEQLAGQPLRQGRASQPWHFRSSARSCASVRNDGAIGLFYFERKLRVSLAMAPGIERTRMWRPASSKVSARTRAFS
jgi:hypothetical protein